MKQFVDSINIDELNKINLQGIRMCSFDLDSLIEIYNLVINDKKIDNFDYEDILYIISQFIRLKNDYEALIKFVNGTDLRDTMTQFLIEQYKEGNQ